MKPLWTAVAILITLGAYGAVRAQPQRVESNQSDPPTMTQLLQEVRALRLAIERSTVAGTRAQLLLGPRSATRFRRLARDFSRSSGIARTQ